MLRYKLRTLMIVLAVVPVLLAALLANLFSVAYSRWIRSHSVFPQGAEMRDFIESPREDEPWGGDGPNAENRRP